MGVIKMLTLDEIEMLCFSIEGGLATSSPDFIQEVIDSIKGNAIRHISLKTRLKNIKRNLEGK